MVIFILRLVEKLLIVYFTIYFIIDLALFFYSLFVFIRRKKTKIELNDYTGHIVSVIVPAYNEDVSIVHCTQMLLELDYPDYEVIVVNDGSTDSTLQLLKDNFNLEEAIPDNQNWLITAPVRNTYQSNARKLIVIDKHNGGKADSINTGINFSRGNYICTIDADSILDPNALKEVVKPFITQPNTIVSGGQLAASNDMVLVHNKVVSSKTPTNIWVLWQIIEYIKSFMISRIGLSRINALLIMSGAFSLFRKEDLLEVGGFLTARNEHPYIVKTIGKGNQTVCEDMEIVVRLWQYKRDKKLKARAAFLPEPVCWTEVPDNGRNLFKQRSRWHQGLAETLKIHRRMIFEPSYGMTGMVGLPYYFLFELFSPLVRLFTLFFIVLAAIFGLINFKWVIMLITSVMLITAIILSAITAIIENWSSKQYAVNRDALRYKSFKDWLWLLTAGIIAEFYYSFFKLIAQTNGMINFMRKKNNWNKFSRKGMQRI